MAAPSAWVFHDKAKEKAFNGGIDYDTDAFVVRLYSSASDINTPANNDASLATNELASANGYSAGGTSVTVTVAEAGGVVTLDATDASWSASGAGITARYAAIICTTTTPDEIIAHTVLDSAPADVSAAAGKLFVVQFHNNGFGLVT